MEGLTFGWRRSITRYHFFDIHSQSSVCGVANFIYHSNKKIEFLTEIELDQTMDICKECYSGRKTLANKKIIEAKNDNGFWDDTHVCPGCENKVMFWNSNQNKDHYCTICKRMVTLA